MKKMLGQNSIQNKEGMVLKKLPAYFLFGCIGLVIFLLYRVFVTKKANEEKKG